MATAIFFAFPFRSCYRGICFTKLAVKRVEQKNFVLIQNVSEIAAKLKMPNLENVHDNILLAHTDHLIDYNKCLVLYHLNWSKILTYHIIVIEKFDLD